LPQPTFSSRPQAMNGSPEGQVPLALSAEDRPPRRRTKRQFPSLQQPAALSFYSIVAKGRVFVDW